MNGKADLELIVDTYYDIRYLNLTYNGAYTKTLKKMSPVAAEILNSDISGSDKKRLFYSWYIRQIPYAAKALYDYYYKGEKSWDKFLEESEAFMNENEDELNIILMGLSWPMSKDTMW